MNKNIIILISGRMGNGKDSVTNIICDELKSDDTIVHHEKFAAYLKEMCSSQFQPMLNELNNVFEKAGLTEHITNKENFYDNKTLISRFLMQSLGSIMRDVDPDFWIKYLAHTIQEKLQNNQSKDNVVVVSDWRYRNELSLVDYINQYRQNYPAVDVKLVRITRPSVSPNTSVSFHPSELDLDDFKGFNYHINNYGSLATLRSKVKIMLAEFGLSK